MRMTADEFNRQHGKGLPVPTTVMGRPVRAKLTPSGPTATHANAIRAWKKRHESRPLERDVQAGIVEYFRLQHVPVMVTSQRRASGVTLGMPDLYVYVADGLWIGLEVKRDEQAARESTSPEQRALADAGCIGIVWTVEMAARVWVNARNQRRKA